MSNVIIPCPTCTSKLRMPGDRTLMTTCPSCNTKFKVSHGRIVEVHTSTPGATDRYFAWLAEKGNPFYLRPWFLVFVPFLLIIVGLWYKTTIYEEKVRYAAFQEEPSVNSANYYLKGFGESDRAAGVLRGRDSLQLEDAAASIDSSCDEGACSCYVLKEIQTNTLAADLRGRYAELQEACAFRTVAVKPSMSAVNGFLAKYSNSERYADSIQSIRQNVLDGLVGEFNAKNATQGDLSRDQVFFRGALDYVARSGDNVILVDFTQRTALKDWKDYPQEVKDLTDQMIEFTNAMEKTSYPMPSVRPPGSINSFFRSNTQGLENGLISSVQTKMDSIFGERSLIVRRKPEGESADGIVLNVEYLVSTLEDDMGESGTMPSLYIWSQTESRGYGSNASPVTTRFKGYMLATSIDWDLRMDYPGADGRYGYTKATRPQGEIRNINTETAALQRMMSTAFDEFSRSFLEEFGVK